MNKTCTKLSIVVTVYNGADVLKKCLDSLYAQTYENLEILCVDDGSSDQSLKILEQEACAHPKVRVIHQSNQGAWFARKTGLREASGKWIGFVDCDDTVDENMYQEMISLGEQEPDIDLVVCAFHKVDEETGEIYAKQMSGFGNGVRDAGKRNRGFLAAVNPSMCNKIFRLRCAQKAMDLAKAPRIMEDFIFIASIMPLFRKVAFTEQAFYQYYNRKDSVTKTIGCRDIKEAKEAMLLLKDYWNDRYKDHVLLDLLAFLHLGIAITINYNQKEGISLKHIWQDSAKFLDTCFPLWKRNQYLTVRYCRKNKMMWKIYLTGRIFGTPAYPVLVRLYQYLSDRLGIDMKW